MQRFDYGTEGSILLVNHLLYRSCVNHNRIYPSLERPFRNITLVVCLDEGSTPRNLILARTET